MLHGNSDNAAPGLQHFVCGQDVVDWRIGHCAQDRVNNFEQLYED